MDNRALTMELYPLKFNPIFCYRIWGGKKLKTVLNKQYEQESVGESWEISDVENFETSVSEGLLQGFTLKELIRRYKARFLGNHVYEQYAEDFPLLIKFIDAEKPLSIQVHPSNELAKRRHSSFGKNEMWYVMEAEPDAELIVGFNTKITKQEYAELLENDQLEKILNCEKVYSGDTFYIPTGRVHAIGAGVLLAEIQQTSDITYRIYDYNRIDAISGKKRELHNDLALDAIDYGSHNNYRTHYDLRPNVANELVQSEFFKTNILSISEKVERDYTNLDSFVIIICVERRLELESIKGSYVLNKGETILIPAVLNKVRLNANGAKVLEVHV